MISARWLGAISLLTLPFALSHRSSANALPDLECTFRRRAYVTVITTQDYVEPAMIMGASLRASTLQNVADDCWDTDYVCLALTEKSADKGAGINTDGLSQLTKAGWDVRPIREQIWNPNYVQVVGEYNKQRHVWNYNKLWIWSLCDYDRVVYLDSDMLILKDIGDLFDLDVWTDDGAPANATHTNFAAAPDMIPPDKFNSGVLVLRPDEKVFSDMLDAVQLARFPSYDKGDQGFLNEYFSDWYQMPAASRLGTQYNAPYSMASYEPVWKMYRKDIRIIHFYGPKKPWRLLDNPKDSQVPAVAAPLLYLWMALRYLVRRPASELEREARFILSNVFDIEGNGEAMVTHLKQQAARGGHHSKQQRQTEL